MAQLSIHPDNATDAQLIEMREYHKEQWMRFARLVQRREERKRFKAILACGECAEKGEVCKEHRT